PFGERQVARQLGAATSHSRVARFDAATSELTARPKPSQEPHRAVVPDGEYQGLLGGHGSVWAVGPDDAKGDCRRAAGCGLDGRLCAWQPAPQETGIGTRS